MNKEAELYYRGQILQALEKLPEAWQRTFKLMYGRGKELGRGRMEFSVEETEARSAADVVSTMAVEKLDWALTQIHNSTTALAKKIS